jgi:hypothetical protein
MTENTLSQSAWLKKLRNSLPVFGHRNWIVIADAAYPQQNSDGIETVVADAEQIDMVRMVFEMITASNHVRARVYTDLELDFVSEEDAHGVTNYRESLRHLLGRTPAKQLQHEEIIAKLEEQAEKFRILILKTRMTIPYTSVFCELECGYWSVEAEERLREAMRAKQNAANGRSEI